MSKLKKEKLKEDDLKKDKLKEEGLKKNKLKEEELKKEKLIKNASNESEKNDNEDLIDEEKLTEKTSEILKEVVKLYQSGEKKADVAAAGQNAIARGLSKLAIQSADKKYIKEIGATGGVFYNEAITNTVKNCIENNGFNFIQHKNTCAGDGSVSLGQAIIAKKL